MDNLIKIEYRDKENWVTLLDQIQVTWTDYSTKYKKERIKPTWVNPEEITNTWNGAAHDVQVRRWDSYSFQFNIKESEVHDINKLRSTSDKRITEFSEDSNGIVKTKEYIIDNSLDSYFDIQAEPIAKSTAFKITVNFRTNNTVINKANPILNTNSIRFSATTWTVGLTGTLQVGENYLAAMSPTRFVALKSGYLYVFNLISSVWTLAAPGFNTGLTSEFAVVGFDSNNIAVVGDNKLRKYSWNGSTFTLQGNTYTFISTITSPSITKLDNNIIALMDNTTKYLEAYQFDSTDWAQLGNSLDLTTTSSLGAQISAHSASDIVYYDSYNKELRNYSWDGSDFTEEHATVLTIDDFILIAKNSTDVAIVDNDNDILYLYTNTGSAYTSAINPYSLTEYNYNSIIRISDTEILIANYDYTNSLEKTTETPSIYLSSAVDMARMSDTLVCLLLQYGDYETHLVLYELIGTTWTVVTGSLFEIPNPGSITAIDSVSSTNIAIRQGGENLFLMYNWNGTAWSLVGNEYATLPATSKPQVCGLTATTAATFDFYDAYLRFMEFDGTDWTDTGTPYHNTDIDVLGKFHMETIDSTNILFWDSFTQKFKIFTWGGSSWTLNANQYLLDGGASVLGNNLTFGLVSTTEGFIVDSDNKIVRGFTIASNVLTFNGNNIVLTPTSEYSGTTGLTSTGIVTYQNAGYKITTFDISEVNNNKTQQFLSDGNTYYTDFDVVENTEEIESILVDWSDGSKKVLQTTHAKTLEMLFYFTSTNKVEFLGQLKKAGLITINGTTLNSYTLEQGQIGYDYYFVIIRGNIDTEITNFDLSPNNTYNLKIVSDATYNYYTDFAPEFIDEAPEISTSNNNAGVNKATKNISKQVKRLVFFENQTDAFTLKQKYELGGTVTLDTVPILETRPATVTKLGYDIYRIEIDALIAANERY